MEQAKDIGREPNAQEVLYIIIPAYNEEANIDQCIDDWYPIVERHSAGGGSRLVIINDGSKDKTYEVMQERAKELPLFQPLTKPNGGHGPTLLYGYRYAIENGADFIFQTDSDGQTSPAEFEQFWELRHAYAAIFGNRTERGDGKDRAFVERTLCRILRHYFKVQVPDANAPFRLMRSEYVGKYIGKLREDYNLPNAMLVAYGAYYHEAIKFIPISFKPRQAGTNSINVKKIVKIGWQALRDFKELRRGL